ncbi:hypothetical protein DL764_001697 [Monosporascus ibericus]|uniref:Uncharacterized protein n=1 Tax=Monosporascus ibericus TaxID=155417 RepID=A0A4Q4TNH2_9PEZI|nr:hypothetical protein DL764_001697 [Monosporascus ibericus]
MDSSREKELVRYGDLPEVVIPHLPEAYSYVNEGRRVEPGESPPKFLAIDSAEKEVDYPNSPEVVSGHESTAAGTEGDHVSPTHAEQSLSGDGKRKHNKERRCGYSMKTFWVILALVFMGAAIGGGVGGSMAASRDADNQPLGADAPSSTTTRTLVPTVSATSVSTPPPTPTVFLNNNTEDFAFQAFDDRDYEGRATGLFKAQGHFALEFNVSSYVWQPNGTRCCVTMCRESTWAGWWCQPKPGGLAQKQQPAFLGILLVQNLVPDTWRTSK